MLDRIFQFFKSIFFFFNNYTVHLLGVFGDLPDTYLGYCIYKKCWLIWFILNFIDFYHVNFLFLYLQVGILKRVLEEVEKVIRGFKSMLYKSMEDPEIDLQEVYSFFFISR